MYSFMVIPDCAVGTAPLPPSNIKISKQIGGRKTSGKNNVGERAVSNVLSRNLAMAALLGVDRK